MKISTQGIVFHKLDTTVVSTKSIPLTLKLQNLRVIPQLHLNCIFLFLMQAGSDASQMLCGLLFIHPGHHELKAPHRHLFIQLQGHPGLGDSVLLQLLLHLHHSLPITDQVFFDHTSPLPLRERLTSIRSLILVRYRDNLCKKTRKINNVLISDISSSVYLKKIQLNFSVCHFITQKYNSCNKIGHRIKQ